MWSDSICYERKQGQGAVGNKAIFPVVLIIVLAIGAYFGVLFYKNLQNTPENMTQQFVRNLQQGKTELAYERLTTDLKQGREAYWKNYLAQFKEAEGEATLVSQEFVKDTFSTYPTDSEPQRFVYKFQLQGREYQLSIVTYKLQNVWVVDALSGG